MNLLQTLDDRLFLMLNSLSGRSFFVDTLLALPMENTLVKAGPVGAALIYAWFSGTGQARLRSRSILLVTLAALIAIIAVTKPMGASTFVPRPLVRALPMLELRGGQFVQAPPLAVREPLAGEPRERFEALRSGAITANDLGAFPSDHAALFFPLALGIALACRRAGIVAMGWTVVVILATRVITGMHSPFDILAGLAIGTSIFLLILSACRRWASRLVDGVAQWTMRHEALAASLLFLAAFEITSVLNEIEQLGNTVLALLKGPARGVAAALLALFLASCGSERKAALFVVEPGWRAELIATQRDGITSPDGLRWSANGLLIADEGGSAVRLWRPGQKIVTLADKASGIGSPEDVVSDGRGNIYFTDDRHGGVWRTDAAGKTVRLVGAAQGVGPIEAIAITPSGRLLIGDGVNHRILSVGTDGRNLRSFLGPRSGISKPENIAFAPDGSLFIADDDLATLFHVTPGGPLHREVSGVEGFSPEALYSAGKVLFITDRENGKLYRYTEQQGLKPLLIFAGDLAKLQGVAGDPAGNLYVTIQADIRTGRGYILRLIPPRTTGG